MKYRYRIITVVGIGIFIILLILSLRYCTDIDVKTEGLVQMDKDKIISCENQVDEWLKSGLVDPEGYGIIVYFEQDQSRPSNIKFDRYEDSPFWGWIQIQLDAVETGDLNDVSIPLYINVNKTAKTLMLSYRDKEYLFKVDKNTIFLEDKINHHTVSSIGDDKLLEIWEQIFMDPAAFLKGKAVSAYERDGMLIYEKEIDISQIFKYFNKHNVEIAEQLLTAKIQYKIDQKQHKVISCRFPQFGIFLQNIDRLSKGKAIDKRYLKQRKLYDIFLSNVQSSDEQKKEKPLLEFVLNSDYEK